MECKKSFENILPLNLTACKPQHLGLSIRTRKPPAGTKLPQLCSGRGTFVICMHSRQKRRYFLREGQ